MKRQVIRYLELHALPLLNAYRSIKIRRNTRRYYADINECMRRLLAGPDGQIKVFSGPFEGLLYLDEPVVGALTPKWLGSYENELAGVIAKIVSTEYTTIIDVGCAEGYYAVGLAWRIPHANIFAFDIDYTSRRQTHRLAKLNGAGERVHIYSQCDGTAITRHAIGRTLMICDIEGCERTLLDPPTCATLQRMDILVEVHEGVWTPPTLDLLKSRFSRTHHIEEITSTNLENWIDAVLQNTPLQATREELQNATAEHRDKGQKWLWMTASTQV